MKEIFSALALVSGAAVVALVMMHSSHTATAASVPSVTFDSDEFKINPSVGQTVLKNYSSASEIGFAVVHGTVTFPPDPGAPIHIPVTLPFVETVVPGTPPTSVNAVVRFKGTALTFDTQEKIQSIDLHVVTVYKQ